MRARRCRPLCLSLLVSALIVVAAPLRAVRSQQPAPLALAERVLDSLLADGAPGAMVVIVHNGRVVLSKGFGTGSIDTAAPVTPDMVFRTAVACQPLLALTLLSLSDQGKLDLHAPIGRYVRGLSPQLATVTTHQVLTGTSGIRNDHPAFPLNGDSALGNAIRAWTDTMLIANPGTISSISNPAFQLAGLVIEEVSGKPFSQAMAEGLIHDLGMARTSYNPAVAMTFPISQGHLIPRGKRATVVRPFNFGVFGWPRSDLFSSGADLSRLMLAIVNHGKLDGKLVLSPAVIRRFSESVTVRDGRAGVERRSGYGITIHEYRGVRLLSNNSGWWGNNGLLRVVPEHGFGILILTNGSGPRATIAERVMEMMLPLTPRPPLLAPGISPLTSVQIAELRGVYENERTVTLFSKDGKMFAREEMTPANRARAPDGRGVVGPFSMWDVDLPLMGIQPDQLAIVMPDGGIVTAEIIRDAQNRVVYLRIEGRALRKR